MAPTWYQRGQFEHKFQKMIRYYKFFFKWAILTQNSKYWVFLHNLRALDRVQHLNNKKTEEKH